MIEFPPPILEHFCPFFVQIAQMDLILPRWGNILPKIPPQPLIVTQPSHTPLGICTYTKHPQAHLKTPLRNNDVIMM